MKLGDKVLCKSYLKKVKDGAFIEKINGDRTTDGRNVYLLHPSNRDQQKLENFRISMERAFGGDNFDYYFSAIDTQKAPEIFTRENDWHAVEKIYFERIEQEFNGIVVGVKNVVTEGYLGTHCGIYEYISKTAKTTIKCALVYYALGKSRLVPLYDLEAEHGNKS